MKLCSQHAFNVFLKSIEGTWCGPLHKTKPYLNNERGINSSPNQSLRTCEQRLLCHHQTTRWLDKQQRQEKYQSERGWDRAWFHSATSTRPNPDDLQEWPCCVVVAKRFDVKPFFQRRSASQRLAQIANDPWPGVKGYRLRTAIGNFEAHEQGANTSGWYIKSEDALLVTLTATS